jgi:hypothetical protein
MKQAKVYHKTHVKNGKTYHVTLLTETGVAEKEADIALALIRSTKYDPVQADAFKRECKIGKYREWEWDMVRLKEINDMVISGEVTMHPRIKPKTGRTGRIAGGVNAATGKKQLEREREQFIHQLNNE